MLDRRSALLQAPPLGPAQHRQQEGPKPGGEAVEHQSVPTHWKGLAGSAQVLVSHNGSSSVTEGVWGSSSDHGTCTKHVASISSENEP